MTAQTLSDHNADTMWSRRKSLFFKPLSSFGGKGAYRGEGISRRKFDELIGRDTLAQEFVPAPTVELNGSDWKYDLRFYVYRDHIQYVAGRIYRGQVTNFSHDGGGFCCVDWN
jgi:hypothetical protein